MREVIAVNKCLDLVNTQFGGKWALQPISSGSSKSARNPGGQSQHRVRNAVQMGEESAINPAETMKDRNKPEKADEPSSRDVEGNGRKYMERDNTASARNNVSYKSSSNKSSSSNKGGSFDFNQVGRGMVLQMAAALYQEYWRAIDVLVNVGGLFLYTIMLLCHTVLVGSY